MKRKWKWLILLCLAVLCFAVWIVSVGGRPIPVDVVGELSEKEVAEIVAAARREMRREVLPNFSWQSLKNMASVIKRNSSIKLITIFKREPFAPHEPGLIPFFPHRPIAYVYLWSNTNGLQRLTSTQGNYMEFSDYYKRPPAAKQFATMCRPQNCTLYSIGNNGHEWRSDEAETLGTFFAPFDIWDFAPP
jgi:hypothetical protein